MRERPLSMTILGWSWLILALLNLTTAIIPDKGQATEYLGWSNGIVQGYEVLIYGFTALCCLPILRGKIWARNCFSAVLVLELLRMVLLEWQESKNTFPMEVCLTLVTLWLLFRKQGRDYFNSGEPTPLTYQLSTAICYVVMTLSLMLALGMPAGWTVAGDKALYLCLMFSVLATVTYGIGRTLGLVLEPRADLGKMLTVAAVVCVMFVTTGFLSHAGSMKEPASRLYVILTVAICSVSLLVGLFLIRSSRIPIDNARRALAESAAKDD